MKEKDDSWVGFFKANPLFAPILFTLFILALATAPFHPKICAEGEHYPCKDVIREGLLARFFYYMNYYSGAIVAFFTATLWGSAIWQGRLTRDSINLAREEFIASHRPLIAIRGLILMEPTEELPAARMIFIVQNSGSSLARVTEIIFLMRAEEPNNVTWPPVVLSSPRLPVEIKPGYDIRPDCDVDSMLWTFWPGEEAGAIESKNLTLRITVNYEDVMGARRQTSIHRKYDWGRSRFHYVGGSEFEYQT